MNLEELNKKLEEIDNQINILSSQRDNVINAINVNIANNNIGDVLYNVYKVLNDDNPILRIHTGVKDICQTTSGQGIVYETVMIRLDIGTTVHISTDECVYVNADEFRTYNEYVSKEELMGMKKVYDVIKGIILMNGVYRLS